MNRDVDIVKAPPFLNLIWSDVAELGATTNGGGPTRAR
eukprot:CAMPEP_0171776864 /NCGR_PEP_ID=MMETSP0991-20121206/57424_1 /TAXON_ID=483369 /ORGANISM="non described non described, Strain CCMP2098" /LENGTH=37 /DNA_ID= /DNA_START= /DNA_END= /DNA_ORIENTATION=